MRPHQEPAAAAALAGAHCFDGQTGVPRRHESRLEAVQVAAQLFRHVGGGRRWAGRQSADRRQLGRTVAVAGHQVPRAGYVQKSGKCARDANVARRVIKCAWCLGFPFRIIYILFFFRRAASRIK